MTHVRRILLLACLLAPGTITGVRAQGGPGPELWVVLQGTAEIAIVDVNTGAVDPLTIDISDPDGDRVIDPPWGLAFSRVAGNHGTHAFVSQQSLITVVDVATRTVLHHFDLTSFLPTASLDLRGCASSIPRQFFDPAGGPVVRSLLHCAATDAGGNAVFVVLDQAVLIAGGLANPVVGDGTLAAGATGVDVTVQDTPRGTGQHQRAWYTVTRSGAPTDDVLGVQVTTSDTLPFAFQVDQTRTYPLAAAGLPQMLGPSAPTGGELPAMPQSTLGRLENLDTEGGCDPGGDLVAMSVTGFGANSYTVLAIDNLSQELLAVDAASCTTTHTFTVGANPVAVTTLGDIRWQTAWVANFDDDTLTQINDDGTVAPPIALGPPPGAICSKCPISMGVTKTTSQECDGIDLQVSKEDTNMNGLIDRIVLEWTPIGCDSITEFTIGCRCVDETDVTCPCICDCDLPQPPEECLCPGPMAFAGGMPNGLPLQTPTGTIDETPWIILGSSPGGGGGTFNHDIPDGNTSDLIYNLEPSDP